MSVACVCALVASVISANVGAQAAPLSTLQLVAVVAGVVLFAVGAVLMIVVAAGEPPVLAMVEPWGDDDES